MDLQILDLGVNLYRGEFFIGANCLGVNFTGANCLRGQLSRGPIVPEGICIGVNCLRGQLSRGELSWNPPVISLLKCGSEMIKYPIQFR